MLGRGITAILVGALLVPVGAAAQSDRPDPDSPAGVEYELPLDQTRKDLSDNGKRPESGGGENGASPGSAGGSDGGAAPLFGAGISREVASGGEGGGQNPPDGGQTESGTEARAPSADGEQGDSDPAVTKASTGDGGSTGLLLPGLVLLVILAGGAIGLLLRRGLGARGS